MDTVADVEVRYGGKDSRVSDSLHVSHVLSEMLNVVWCQIKKGMVWPLLCPEACKCMARAALTVDLGRDFAVTERMREVGGGDCGT